MSTTTPENDTQDNLAWERANAPRAAFAAVAAGVLSILGLILGAVAYSGAPHTYLVDAIRDAAGQSVPDGGLRTAYALFIDDRSVIFVLSALVLAVSSILIAPVLGYLYRATDARSPRLTKLALYASLIGPILLGVGQLLLQVALVAKARSFAGGSDRSTQAAHDVFSGGLLTASQVFGLIGVLTLALAFVLVSLNAMRVGLLTRFMGVLGIIVGVLFILQSGSGGGASIGQGASLIQTFWLVAVGWLILGRWPSGVPEAWTSGEAKPWPTQQALREQREAAARAAAGEPEPVAATPAASGAASARTKKKRKRR